MTLLLFSLLVLSTSFLAGIFGMAGGMVLMGGLLLMMPVSAAMVLHGITQMTSNAWRALMWRKHIEWRIVSRYCGGLLTAALLFAAWKFTPDERLVLLALGVLPLAALALPRRQALQIVDRGRAEAAGFLCTATQLISGVSGPLLDIFFVRSDMDRRTVVATKAARQVVTHLTKSAYFGLLFGGISAEYLTPSILSLAVALAIVGTWLSRSVLEGLTDASFRRIGSLIVGGIGIAYIIRGIIAFA